MKSELNIMKLRQICRYGEIIFSILESADAQSHMSAPYYSQLRQIILGHYAAQEKAIGEQVITTCIVRAILMLAAACLEDGSILAHFSAGEIFTQIKPLLLEQLEIRK